MNQFDWQEVASRTVGVIDLRNGHAVHGIAGDRSNYSPVQLANFRPGATSGNPFDLFLHYYELGLRHFYVADLDSLCGKMIQYESVGSLIKKSPTDSHWIIDAGLDDPTSGETCRWIENISMSNPESVSWVIASESAKNPNVASDFASRFGSSRTVLGIDLRDGRYIGPDPVRSDSAKTSHNQQICDDQSENDSLTADQVLAMESWVRRATDSGIRSALILDVGAVGTSRGPATLSLCRDFRKKHPDWRIISGGGCRNPLDVHTYFEAGCDDCMVATALHC